MIPPLVNDLPPPATGPSRSDEPLGAWTAVALGLGGFFACQVLLFTVAALTNRILLALAAGAMAGVLVPVGVALRLSGRNPLRALQLERVWGRDAGLALLLVVAAFAPTYALGAWSQRLFPPGPEAFAVYEGLIPTGPVSLILGLLVVSGLAPLAEEILFRGLFLQGLGRLLPWGTAVALQALGFGISHGALWMLAPITILGVLLGLLRGRTGSLASAWIAHGLYNGLAYADLCMTHDVRGTRLERWALEPWVLVPSTVVLGLLALWLGRQAGDARRPTGLGSGDDPLVTG